MPVTTLPSNVPASPIDITGAPRAPVVGSQREGWRCAEPCHELGPLWAGDRDSGRRVHDTCENGSIVWFRLRAAGSAPVLC